MRSPLHWKFLKSASFILMVIFAEMQSLAQSTYYDFVKLGSYEVGFSDTILYDDQILYNQYGYNGPAPIFVQLWFPTASLPKSHLMAVGEYRHQHLPQTLDSVYHILTKCLDESFIRDGLSFDLINDEPIAYGSMGMHEVLHLIEWMPSQSSRMRFKPMPGQPAIVYHHGSQGMPDENLIMAEYFASRGYLFVSANYHLPYPDTPYGLLPYALEQQNRHDQSSAKAVIDFVKSISQGSPPFFIGHSWGAQEGWCFLHDTAFAKAFVSMETTIEFKRDTLEIQDKWPHVYEALKTKQNSFSIPILALAADEPSTNFDFFRESGGSNLVCASYKEPFAHNSYTSFYTMRYFLKASLPQTDEEALLSQIIAYNKHLELIYDFLESVRVGQQLDKAEHESFVFPK